MAAVLMLNRLDSVSTFCPYFFIVDIDNPCHLLLLRKNIMKIREI